MVAGWGAEMATANQEETGARHQLMFSSYLDGRAPAVEPEVDETTPGDTA